MSESEGVSQRMRSHLILSLKILLSVALLGWLIATDRLPIESLTVLFNPALLAWGLAFLGATFFLASERWRALLATQGLEASPWQCFQWTLVGVYFGFFLPGGVGGDVVKGYYVIQNLDGRKGAAIGSVIYDRLIGLFSMTLFCGLAVSWNPDLFAGTPSLHPLLLMVAALFCFFVGLFGALWSRRFQFFRNALFTLAKLWPPAEKFLERLLSFRLQRRDFMKILLLSLASQACNIGLFMGFPLFLNEPTPPLEALVFVVPLGFIATAVPLSPGGVGVGQAAFFFLYNLVSQEPTQLGSLSVTLFQLLSLLFGLVGAYFYLRLGKVQSTAESLS